MIDEKRLFELKRQYNAIPVPDQLEERIKETMEKTNINNERKPAGRGFRALRASGISIAAAFLIIFGLANASPATALAMQSIPVIGPIAKFLTVRTFEAEENGVSCYIEIPEMSGMQDETAQNNLNAAVNAYVDELMAQYQADADSMGEALAQDPEAFEDSQTAHVSYQTFASVATDNDRVFSVCLTTDLTMAGAQEFLKHFTVDRSTGAVLALSDLFAEGSDYVSALKADVLAQMKARTAADSSLDYFPDELDAELTPDTDFYIDDSGELVLCFGEYAVSPGFMGAQQFTVSRAAIDGIAAGALENR